MAKGFVYILRSLKNGRFYIGSTTDINKRLLRHESGNVRATRNFLPVRLELCQEFDNYTYARKIEQRLKDFKRKDFIEKIVKEGIIKLGL